MKFVKDHFMLTGAMVVVDLKRKKDQVDRRMFTF